MSPAKSAPSAILIIALSLVVISPLVGASDALMRSEKRNVQVTRSDKRSEGTQSSAESMVISSGALMGSETRDVQLMRSEKRSARTNSSAESMASCHDAGGKPVTGIGQSGNVRKPCSWLRGKPGGEKDKICRKSSGARAHCTCTCGATTAAMKREEETAKQDKDYALYLGPGSQCCNDGVLSQSRSRGRSDCQQRCSASTKCKYISLWSTGGANWCQLTTGCTKKAVQAQHTINVYANREEALAKAAENPADADEVGLAKNESEEASKGETDEADETAEKEKRQLRQLRELRQLKGIQTDERAEAAEANEKEHLP